MQLRDVGLESKSFGDLNAVRQQITEELWIALTVRIMQLILPNGILRKDYLCVEHDLALDVAQRLPQTYLCSGIRRIARKHDGKIDVAVLIKIAAGVTAVQDAA